MSWALAGGLLAAGVAFAVAIWAVAVMVERGIKALMGGEDEAD